jgi:hypothetical protein
LQDLPFNLVQLDRLALDLHLQLAGSLVDEIDSLVGEESGGDIPVGKDRRSDQSLVLYPHAMMHFIPFLESTKNGYGVLDAWFLRKNRLESSLQGLVGLDVLAILIQCGGSDRPKFAPRKRRFQQVGGIGRSFGCPCSHKGMQLVDKQYDLALRSDDFVDHGLQSFLELAPELCPGDQGPQIQGQQTLGQ